MGLDMNLERMPRYKNITPSEVYAITSYLDWKQNKREKDYTLEEWCGVKEDDIPKEAIKFYEQYFTMKYWAWDDEHKYGHMMIEQEVASWRKANAIHKWFVDNVQDGEDDCGIYEVTKGQLEELLDICKKVKEASQMEKGYVHNGDRYANGMWCPNYEAGEYIIDTEVAEELLPTQGGFFFGSTDYDQWYMQDIEYTIEILTKVLQETDFETHMIAYGSSW